VKKITIAPENSILFISGTRESEIPEITRGSKLWSTNTCVAFGTFPEQDGKTSIILGKIEDVSPGHPPDMETFIETPKRRLAVETVGQDIVLETSVPNLKTRVAIWLSHPHWPEEVRIGLG